MATEEHKHGGAADAMHPGSADPAIGFVLVVDDEKSTRRLVARVLTKAGYECVQCSDGSDAVTILKTRARDCALVLMDFQMPIMDGITATTAIRKFNESIPIVGVTGDMSEAERALKVGMNDVLEKPLDSAALRDAVEHHARGGGKRSSMK